MPAEIQFAMLIAIDRVTRARVDEVEFVVTTDALCQAFGRAPDFRDEHMISWGSVTYDEVVHLARAQLFDEDRDELIAELGEFFAKWPTAAVSLYQRPKWART
jgi:hypothetical protein